MVKKYKIYPGDPGLPGTHETKNGLNFAIRIPNDLPASLVILSGNDNRIEQEIDLPVQGRCGEMAAVALAGRKASPIPYYYVIGGKKTIDPYARRIVGDVCYTDPERYSWGDDASPNIPLADMIVYKLHVRGFTKDPKSGVLSKGTFRGLMQKIPYLKGLGINAVELMPVYEWSDQLKRNERRAKAEIGLPERNFWGYAEKNCYYAPKQLFSSQEDSVTEFKTMVKALHRAGIEVILEMYFPKEADQFEAISAMRFWKTVYHVDGFHAIGNGVSKEALCADPLLARTKLFFDWIDADRIYGGQLPLVRRLATANGFYQSEARRFLKGDPGAAERFRWMLKTNPGTHAVVNYVANVNGFTLADAVSYNERHNEANGESGKDGTSDNNSWNCGIEGPTRRKPVVELRRKQIRNALAYVFLSQGIPLLYAGDEFCNTQGGNNNAYASDDPVGWVSWRIAKRNKDLTEYVRKLIAFRKEHGILHGERELRGTDYLGKGLPDISFHDTKAWYAGQGPDCRSFAVMFNGAYARKPDGSADDLIYVCCSSHWECHTFALPQLPRGMNWDIAFSTDDGGFEEAREGFARWAKEEALGDVRVRLDRVLTGLESHRELVLAEEERARQKVKAAAAAARAETAIAGEKEKTAWVGTGTAVEDEKDSGGTPDGTAAAAPSGTKIPAGDETAAGTQRGGSLKAGDFDALRQKYIQDAKEEAARIETSFKTSDFPKNQKYIAVPPRSVTVLIAVKKEAGES